MYRPLSLPPTHYQPWHQSLGRLLALLTIWICVSASLRYGYYGDSSMVLGPSSSRLIKTSPVFVKQVEVRDNNDKKGVFLYGFSEKPVLNVETNWSVSKYMTVASSGYKGFSLWLNKGSRIHITLEAQSSSLNQLQVVIIKGERKYETYLPNSSGSFDALKLIEPTNCKQAEYMVEEDDRYYLGLINTNPKRIMMKLRVDVASKMYDLSKARNMCSTIKGSCRLKLQFPGAQYLVLTTPDNVRLRPYLFSQRANDQISPTYNFEAPFQGDTDGWFVELSFMARVVAYIAILGLIILVIILLVLKYLAACDANTNILPRQSSESGLLMPGKSNYLSYRTNEEDDEEGSSISSSEDLYNAKLCAICYDDQRNCFFVPCGHSVTCYECAQRIMVGERKCPICRRLIRKVRRLFGP